MVQMYFLFLMQSKVCFYCGSSNNFFIINTIFTNKDSEDQEVLLNKLRSTFRHLDIVATECWFL